MRRGGREGRREKEGRNRSEISIGRDERERRGRIRDKGRKEWKGKIDRSKWKEEWEGRLRQKEGMDEKETQDT